VGLIKKFNDTKIGFKLAVAFFFIAFLSILVIGYLSYVKGKNSLEEESFNRLTAVREMKASQIESYFQDIRNQIITFSEEHTIVEAMVDFKKGFDTIDQQSNYSEKEVSDCHNRLNNYYRNEFLPRLNTDTLISATIENHLPSYQSAVILQDLYISNNENPVGRKHYLNKADDTSCYATAHAEFHPLIRSYLEKFDYYDIFLVDNKTGHIIYSVYKEVDFGTSLIDGPYANSNIAKAFMASRDAHDSNFVKLVDFSPYVPSYNAPASFISTPVFHRGQNVGTLIFQMPIKRIDDIMTSRHEWAEVGLGKSGETYIVAEDFTLRNQSRFLIEDRKNYLKMIKKIGTPKSTIDQIATFESTVGLQEVKTEGTEAALAGKSNTKIFKDYRGVEVLSSYKPLDIKGMHWVIMSEIDKDEAFAHVYDLRNNIIIIFFGLLISISIASLFISRKITKPLKQLTQRAEELADGDLDVEIDPRGGDEIGTLSKSFIHMQHSISDLVHNLEDKVEARTSELKERNVVIEEKNKEIVDSINYALRLQKAIIPTESKVKKAFPKSLVYFKPKDIVSGDFYWMSENRGKVIIGAIDCTGHGVPGAIVSVVGANGLNRCVKEFDLVEPADILDRLTLLVQETFESGEDKVKDGMDGALCTFDLKTNKMSYAGAHNPLWIIRKNAVEVEEIKADKQPIGNFDFAQEFTNHEIQLNEGDTIFIFSDGYVDQFGGPKGKKFKYKTLKNLLIENKDKTMEELYTTLDDTFMAWKDDLEQLDDVCVIGIRV
jgi:serine phosphatase RsbU (regulator of sigma subunit)